jgi:hypothetical protein
LGWGISVEICKNVVKLICYIQPMQHTNGDRGHKSMAAETGTEQWRVELAELRRRAKSEKRSLSDNEWEKLWDCLPLTMKVKLLCDLDKEIMPPMNPSAPQ